MPDFLTTPPIPYVPIADKATEVRTAIDAARLSAANSFGGLQKLAIPGPFATDAEANTFGVPDDNLYYRSDGTVRAASHISLDLAFALDKTLTARTGPTPTFSRASSGLFTNANGSLVGKTAGTTDSITPSATTLGTTQVTVTVASGSVVGWLVGQSVSLIVDTDGGNDNDASELWLVGTIVSTTATELVFTVTEKTSTAGSQTAWTLGYRGARFDHDETGVCKGLLIEESRGNLLPRSNQFNTSPWSPTAVTVAEVAGGGLDGGSAWRLTPTGADSSLGQVRTIAVTAAHTLSVWLKSDTGSNVMLSLSVFDNTANTNRGVKSVTVTTQWQRFEITTSTVVAGNSTAFIIGAFSSWSTGENVLAFGAQLEAGAFPTSYIPTTIGTAARSADVCSIIGTDFSNVWNPTEVTLYAESSRLSLAGILNHPILVASGSGVDRLGLYHRSSQGMRLSSLSNGFQTTVASNFNQAGVRYKAAVGLSASSNGVFFGGTEVPNNFLAVPSGFADTLLLSGTIISGPVNGHLASLRIYRKRLANAKLQTLTTP